MNPCISTPVPSGVDVLFLPDGLELQESYTLLFLWGTCPCVCCLNEREELPPLPDDASGVLLSFSPFSTATSPSHWPPAANTKR